MKKLLLLVVALLGICSFSSCGNNNPIVEEQNQGEKSNSFSLLSMAPVDISMYSYSHAVQVSIPLIVKGNVESIQVDQESFCFGNVKLEEATVGNSGEYNGYQMNTIILNFQCPSTSEECNVITLLINDERVEYEFGRMYSVELCGKEKTEADVCFPMLYFEIPQRTISSIPFTLGIRRESIIQGVETSSQLVSFDSESMGSLSGKHFNGEELAADVALVTPITQYVSFETLVRYEDQNGEEYIALALVPTRMKLVSAMKLEIDLAQIQGGEKE